MGEREIKLAKRKHRGLGPPHRCVDCPTILNHRNPGLRCASCQRAYERRISEY